MADPVSSRPGNAGKSGKSGTKGLLAWAFYDWANSAFPTVITTFVFAAYFTRKVAADEASGTNQWGNAVAAAGLMVAVLGPIFGAIADQTGRRKPWLGSFTLLCVAATACLWWIQPGAEYALAGLIILVVATVGAEFSGIFYNAMLPDLAPRNRIGRWSGWAWGLGYAGGLACLLVAMGGFLQTEAPLFDLNAETAEPVRATFLLVAVWYAVFALPLFLFTPDRAATGRPPLEAARNGLRQLGNSLKNIKPYAHIVRFLIARMIYADGLATVFAFGGVYAAGTFDMTEIEVVQFGIALNVTAGLGAMSFAWIDDRIGGKRTIQISLMALIVSVGVLLLAPNRTYFWICGLLMGIFVGPVQAASRSTMARLAPEHLRTEMFGLYAFSGKATSFLGPLLVGLITAWSNSQRIGLIVVPTFFVIGLILLRTVPIPRESEEELKEA